MEDHNTHKLPLLNETSTSIISRAESEESDTGTITGVTDFFREFFIESKKVWYLAGPSILTTVCQYGLGALTQIYAGQLGTIQLAAVSMENSVIAGLGCGILLGMGSALETLCGQAFGAKHFDVLGVYMQRSWLILNATCLGTIFMFFFATPILRLLGQEESISVEAGKYSLMMFPQQFAYALAVPLAKFLQAQSKVLEMAVIAAAALCLHAFLGWLLMLKLNWGLSGAALVLNSSWWFIALGQFFYAVSGSCGQAWSGFSWKAFSNLWEFVKLSVSSAIMYCLEIWYIMALTLVAGYLPNAEISVAALSICMNIVGWSAMVGLGFNVAISVRVSNKLGSGQPRAAKFSVLVVGLTSLLLSLFVALILLVGRYRFPAFFTTSKEVQVLVADLTPFLGVSILLTALQYALSGVAIGAGWQNFVAYINAACYFLLGVPLSILLGLVYDMGVKVKNFPVICCIHSFCPELMEMMLNVSSICNL
ncbi:OLC1v1028405C3 [Oldenlandia corymbosa var. corymbosa]|uniref:Protein DETOXIFICATION n=1 Tax=Oldenlandia corymbosa var. corymbosa TaxID=529605 RepID=A0AAV1CDG5_OLDCO|nr:OLC1v1028405C3 [Oldenlandia corymbosa var. corymbosa]